ncbi:hypothetical protein DINM_001272 [Dirofilaria immitis]|nr:hypothetical protein [Dirofilaria immitis]
MRNNSTTMIRWTVRISYSTTTQNHNSKTENSGDDTKKNDRSKGNIRPLTTPPIKILHQCDSKILYLAKVLERITQTNLTDDEIYLDFSRNCFVTIIITATIMIIIADKFIRLIWKEKKQNMKQPGDLPDSPIG